MLRASLEGWEGHETLQIGWYTEYPPRSGGAPLKGGEGHVSLQIINGIPIPSSLRRGLLIIPLLILVLIIPLLVSIILRIISSRRGLPGSVGESRNRVSSKVFRYPPRSGGASLEARENHETL